MATRSVSSVSSDAELTAYSESDFSEYSQAESSFSEQVTDWDEDTLSETVDDKTFLTLNRTTSPNQSKLEDTPNFESPLNLTIVDSLLRAPIINHDIAELKEILKTVEYRRSAIDSEGRTPLHLACMLGNTEIVNLLLDHGWSRVACTQNLRTPLHEATICGHYQVIPLLAEEKSKELNTIDKYGLTSIHLAALHGEVSCLNELVRLGCNRSPKDINGRLPAHLAAGRGHLKALKVLSESGFVLDGGDNEGRTPAHYSAESGSEDCLRFMHSRGIDLDSADANGWKPAHSAAVEDQLGCLKFLITRGSKISDSDIRGRTLAHIAALHGSIKCLHWVLDQSINPDLIDDMGNSLAHLASSRGNSSCINCIFEHTGTIALKNSYGLTPLQLSKNNGKVLSWEKGMSGQICCKICRVNKENLAKAQAMKKREIYSTIENSAQELFSMKKATEGGHTQSKFQLGKPRMPDGHKVPKRDEKYTKQTWMKRNIAAIFYGSNI